MRKLQIFLTFLCFPGLQLVAQNESRQNEKLKVYIDCPNTWCDMSFIKTEINIVDYLLDAPAADLHILITEQRTGGGGIQYQLIFFGQNQFKNQKDTFHLNTDPNGTEFENRDALIKYIKLGLTPYIAKTGAAKDIKIDMKKAEPANGEKKDSSSGPTKDPWNYWVFRLGINGNINADAVYKSNSYNGNFSANRTTNDLKISFNFNGGKNKTNYEFESTSGITKYEVNNNNFDFFHQIVKSINDHWSYGYSFDVSRSTFSNNKLKFTFNPAIEYNIFRYKDVNNKYFTIRYGVDVRKNSYIDTTLFEKTKETLLGHGLDASISFNQKWGTASAGVNYHNYFQNWHYFNLGISGFVSVRITGGLSFNIFAFGGLTRDQIYLPKEGATEQEVLTRRRQLLSGYNYYTSFGLNYRFGSKLNNFVNPRFEGGGVMFFFN
jgi:hypothetical protein